MDIETRVLRLAAEAMGEYGPQGKALAPPIWQSSTFEFEKPEQVAAAAVAHEPDRFYTRYGNPNFSAVARAVAELEGGEAALVTGSGMGAIMLAFLGTLKSGDHVVAQKTHYVGTMKALQQWLPRAGIEVSLVEQTDLDAFASALRPNTRLIHLESPSNPTLMLTDLGGVAALARGKGITTSIDNTFATPINQRPIAHGIDIVIHSATKYLGGHNDVTAGVVVADSERIAGLWKALIVFGMILHPFEAWLLARGIQTLTLRVARHNASAQTVAEFLESHPGVSRVHYPGLASHPQHDLARQQMDGFGGMVAFELEGGYDTARDFAAKLELARRAVSLGGTHTLIVHAASMIHAHVSREERGAAGISDNLLRISVGLESADDIIADLSQALSAISH